MGTVKRFNDEKIIVTLTSWKKRIHFVSSIIDRMLKQTMKPDKIILNLSYDEFQNKEKDLPKDLINKVGDVFEIYWVKEDTKVYKKIIPTLERFPNDVIISIDDDIDYPNNLIESLYSEYVSYGRKLPVTSGSYKWENNIYTHYGCFSLIKKSFLGKYFDDLYKNVVLKNGIEKVPFCDPIVTYSVLLNGLRYVHTPNLDMSLIRRKSKNDKHERYSEIGNVEYNSKIKKEHDLILGYIKKKYNKSYDDFFKNDIVVNITTWKKRDKFLPKMLENFKNQTLKPNRIVLWLSEDEYDRYNLPEHISKCLSDGMLTDIMWVKKNTYCHKRFECFKVFNNCYNINLDDDILYKPNFLKELIESSKKNQNCVTVYSTTSMEYNGLNVIKGKAIKGPSYKNSVMGGNVCYPPYILPLEIFDNLYLRDRFVKKCDESWIRPILIKHGIMVNSFKEWNSSDYISIDGTDESSVWNENKRVIKDGVREKDRNFFNSILINEAESVCKGVWNKMSIEKWKLTDSEDRISMTKALLEKAKIRGFHDFNVEEPKTWCEKMAWLQLNDNITLRAKCADKIRLHEYSKEKLGEDICVPILKVYDNPEDVDFSKLPNKFVLKCNHGYNFNIICRDKKSLNKDECVSKLKGWLSSPFGVKSCEFHYKNIERKCYAEKFIENSGQLEVTDYKFLCFEGNPTYVQVLNGRHTSDFHLNYYDMDFNFVDICRCDVRNNPTKLDKKPENFDLMKKYAAKLSEDFHFVRVDFYEVDGKVYLGELTFTPAIGFIRWTYPKIDEKFGDMIDISSEIYELKNAIKRISSLNTKKPDVIPSKFVPIRESSLMTRISPLQFGCY